MKKKNFTSKLGQTVGQPANTYNDDNSSHVPWSTDLFSGLQSHVEAQPIET